MVLFMFNMVILGVLLQVNAAAIELLRWIRDDVFLLAIVGTCNSNITKCHEAFRDFR